MLLDDDVVADGEAKAGSFSCGFRREERIEYLFLHAQRSKKDRYSITSSAAISKPGGTVKPSAFAVLRLTTVSNFVGVCTGRSAGFAPWDQEARCHARMAQRERH
jgi:hypothetical protein